MKIRIENILGIEAADLTVTPGEVLEVRGPNAAGKTSIATCLQALLAREANPLGLPVASMREYAHDGAAECGAWLTGPRADTWAVEWVPTRSEGAITLGADYGGLVAHEFAAGLTDFTARMGGKQRAALLQPVLLPDPSSVLDRLRKELGPYLPETDIEGCVAEVERRGWEAAESVYQGRSREAKRQWCEATGRRQYGSRIASDWRPEGWTAEHDALTVLDAEKRLHEAREDRDELLRENAVGEAVLLAAEEARARLPALESALDGHAGPVAAAKDALDTARAALSRADRAYREAQTEAHTAIRSARESAQKVTDDRPDAQCPHCGGALRVIARDLLVEVEAHVPGDTTALETAAAAAADRRDAAVKERDRLDGERETAVTAVTAAERDHAAALAARETAQRDVDDCRRTAAVSGVPDDERRRRQRAAADERVDAQQRMVGAIRARTDAAAQAETVEHYGAILRALGPSGVRAGMLEKRLGALNAGLARLTGEAGWPPVKVTAGGAITVGRRPAALCSESERWRAQAALQMTVAAMTGSSAVVLDRADLLDADSRRGLIAAARVAAKRTAVVLCATGEVDMDAPWTQVIVTGGRTVDPETGEVAT